MLTAAVIIAARTLATFKRVLDEAGYSYTEHKGLQPGLLTLKVQTATAAELQPVLQRAMRESRN